MRPATIAVALAALLAAGAGVRASSAAFSVRTANKANTFTTVADWVAPALTMTAPADASYTNDNTPALGGAYGTATGDGATVTAKLYSGATATGTALQTPTVARNAGTWSATAATLADGTYTAQATQSDTAGNATARANTFTVDTKAPNPLRIAAADGGTTPGRLGVGDSITFTYDDAIAPSSVVPGWDGVATQAVQVRFFNGGTNPSPADRFAVLDSTGAATMTFDSGTTTTGGVNTSANLVTQTVSVTAKVVRSADGKSFTITLDAPPATGVVTTANTAKNMAWTAKAGAKDLAGNALVVSTVTETDSDRDF